MGVELRRASKKYPQQTSVLGESTISETKLDQMVEEGKIPSKSVVRAPWNEAFLEPQGHETVVFDAFFNPDLGFPVVSLLEGLFRLFYIELSQLVVIVIACLAIFEWAMWGEGCEGRAKLFACIHEVSRQTKTRTEDGVMKALSFGSVNL